MQKKIQLALLGAGSMGKRWVRVIAQSKRVSLRAICDRDVVRARALGARTKDIIIVNSWQRLCTHPDIDAVIVALPHVLLAPVSLACIQNGKHVLCEKPGGLHPSEIKQVREAANERKLIYIVGYNHRYHDGFLKARKFFENGTIGKVLFIRARYGFGGRKGYAREWRFSKRQGGGELIDQGVHMIDLARWFLGEFVQTHGITTNLFWGGGVEDNAFVLLGTSKGQVASIHVSWTQWRPLHTFEIYGTKGYLIIDGLGKKYKSTDSTSEQLIIGRRDTHFNTSLREKKISCNSDADLSLVRELRDFINAIMFKKKTIVTSYDALRTLEIVKKIYDTKK